MFRDTDGMRVESAQTAENSTVDVIAERVGPNARRALLTATKTFALLHIYS